MTAMNLVIYRRLCLLRRFAGAVGDGLKTPGNLTYIGDISLWEFLVSLYSYYLVLGSQIPLYQTVSLCRTHHQFSSPRWSTYLLIITGGQGRSSLFFGGCGVVGVV